MIACGGVAIDLCVARPLLPRARLLLDPKKDSLLSEISAVLLAERLNAEFETSSHKPGQRLVFINSSIR